MLLGENHPKNLMEHFYLRDLDAKTMHHQALHHQFLNLKQGKEV